MPFLSRFVGAWPVHQYLKVRFRNQRHYQKGKELAAAKEKTKRRAQHRAEGMASSSELDSMDDNYPGHNAGKSRAGKGDAEEGSGEEESGDEEEGGDEKESGNEKEGSDEISEDNQ